MLGSLALPLYLPSASQVLQLSPDAVEYIDIARRLADGEGFRLGVKAYHVGGFDVLHDGLAERAPLYPLVLATLLRLGLDLLAAQVVNAVLAAVSVALVSAIGTALFGARNGLLAGLLAAASPVVLVRMIPPMTEALAVTLTLLATWVAIRCSNPPRLPPLLAAGAALGLGYLIRPTGAILLFAVMAGVGLMSPDWRRRLAALGAVALGAAPFVIPVSAYSLITRGSLSYSGQTYLYAVHKDADVLRNGYGRALPTATEFITANPGYVGAAILDNVGEYARLLFLDRDWLLPLLPAWPLVILALHRRRYPRAAWPVLLVAGANFFTYAVTWANYQERYQLLTLLLLLPFAVDGLQRIRLSRLIRSRGRPLSAAPVVVAGALLVWSPTILNQHAGQFSYGDAPVRTRDDGRLRWTGPPRWLADTDLSRLTEWIRSRTRTDDALAHGQPWPWAFFTGRPAALLPTKLSAELLRSFLVDYRIAYVLLDTRDRDRRAYQVHLEALADTGVRAVTVGSHRVFDTRPLWR